MKTDLKTLTFSAGDAELLSGVTAVNQRNWRRIGILPARASACYSRFTINEVVRMRAIKCLADCGLSLELAVKLVDGVHNGGK